MLRSISNIQDTMHIQFIEFLKIIKNVIIRRTINKIIKKHSSVKHIEKHKRQQICMNKNLNI